MAVLVVRELRSGMVGSTPQLRGDRNDLSPYILRLQHVGKTVAFYPQGQRGARQAEAGCNSQIFGKDTRERSRCRLRRWTVSLATRQAGSSPRLDLRH